MTTYRVRDRVSGNLYEMGQSDLLEKGADNIHVFLAGHPAKLLRCRHFCMIRGDLPEAVIAPDLYLGQTAYGKAISTRHALPCSERLDHGFRLKHMCSIGGQVPGPLLGFRQYPSSRLDDKAWRVHANIPQAD